MAQGESQAAPEARLEELLQTLSRLTRQRPLADSQRASLAQHYKEVLSLVGRLPEPEKLLTWADGELARLAAKPPRLDLERFILAWSHLLRGRNLVKLDEHEAAEEACRTALQLFRQLPAKVVEYRRGLVRTWRILGLACFWRSRQLEAAAQVETAARKWQEALQAYEKALELEPRDSLTHFNVGYAYQSRAEAYLAQKQRDLGLQDLALAIQAYEKALELEPDDAGAHHNLGNAYLRRGEAYLGQGQRQDALKELEQAIQYYEKTLELDPDDASAHNGLGNAYLFRGEAYLGQGQRQAGLENLEQAIQAYQKALELEPEYAYALNGLGNAYLSRGEAYLGQGQRQDALQELALAIQIYQTALRLDDQSINTFNGLGTAFWRQGKIYIGQARWEQALEAMAAAIQAYQDALQIDPNKTDIYNGLGNVYYARGEAYLAQNLWGRALLELDLAIESYQKAIGLDRNHANAHNGLGSAYFLQGKILLQQGDVAPGLRILEEEAVASFHAALKSRPQDLLVLTNLRTLWQEIGWAHYRHNNPPQAALAFQESLLSYLEALDVSPTAALLKEAEDVVRPLLGILHQLPDDLTPAIIASIKKIYACQELYHPELNEFALLNLANHYRERKDYHLALTVAQEAGRAPELALAAMNLEFALWAEDLQEPAAGVARVHAFLADCPIQPTAAADCHRLITLCGRHLTTYEQWERLVDVARQFLQTLPPQGDYVPVFFDLCADLAMLLRRLDDLRPNLLTAWRKLLNIDVLTKRDSWKQQGLLSDPEDDPFLDFQAILEEGNKERLDRIRRESYQQALADTMATLESWMADFFRTFQEAADQGAVVGLAEAYEHFKKVQPTPINAADRASIFTFFDRLFLDYLPVALKKEDLPLPPAVAGVELEYLSKVQITTSTEYLRHFQNRPADFGPVVLMLAKALELEIHAKFLAQCRQALRRKQLEQAAAPGRDEVAKKLFRLLCQEETVKMTFGELVGAWEIFMGRRRRTEPLLQEIAGHVQRLAGQSPVLSQAFYEVLAGLQKPRNDAAHPRGVIVAYQQARETYARCLEEPLAPNALPPIPAVARFKVSPPAESRAK